MASITIYKDVEVEIDINLDEYKDRIIEALGHGDFIDEMVSKFKFEGPESVLEEIEKQLSDRAGMKIELRG